MKHFFMLIVLLVVTISCGKNERAAPPEPAPALKENVNNDTAEKKQVEAVVRRAYAWAKSHKGEGFLHLRFDASDTIVSGFDMARCAAYLAGLKSTGCFTGRFIATLDRVTAQLNDKLGTGEIVWSTEVVPPPVAIAEINEWCKCSDPDEFGGYDSIIIVFDEIRADKALLHWNWDMKYMDTAQEWPNYHITLLKQGGAWKIDYLEGFDAKNFTP